jgi:hypothetical protein
LASGDAPSCINPNFTRKQACKARRSGRLPKTEEITEGVAAMALQGVPAHEIAAAFNYSQKYAGQLLKDPDVRAAQRRILDKKGASIEKAGETLARQLEAKRTEFGKFQGVIVDERETTDNPSQVAAARTVLEAHGMMDGAGRNGSNGPSIGRLVINVNPKYEAVMFGSPSGETPERDG